MEINYSAYKQVLGMGINFLMSISHGMSPSIFCQDFEATRPMRDEMDGNRILFSPELVSPLCFFKASVFPFLYLDMPCTQICFPSEKSNELEK